MVTSVGIGAAFIAWARREPAVRALIQIGSRVRSHDPLAAADLHSDWDFQIATTAPAVFGTGDWIRAAGLPAPVAYVARPGRLGRSEKISIIFSATEMDLVLLPMRQLRRVKTLMLLPGVAATLRRNPALADFALVLRPGHLVLKDPGGWTPFLRQLVETMPHPRLGDADIATLAAGFFCDYVSARRKIARGEFAAAQRWLHHQLVETNLRLLHELRQRHGEPSYPDARRLERTARDGWAERVTASALPEAASLTAALDRSAATLRDLTQALIGAAWRWPESTEVQRLTGSEGSPDAPDR
jgi:hypothetical protein